jgi:DNA replication protein DnaC
MEKIQDILERNQFRQFSLLEVLESYSHIHLTDDEKIEGEIWAKQKKEKLIQAEELKATEERNRKNMTSGIWSYRQTTDYMRYRAGSLPMFGGKFKIDSVNKDLFSALCYYFSDDKNFYTHSELLHIQNPSLSKGIILAGNFGTGKTWMMKLFSKNQRQVFYIRNAKDIANDYQGNGVESTDFINKFKNPENDSASFYQPYAGLCIDDIGTEDLKNNFGNKKNVIGDLIEQRYSIGNTGVLFHATTNLNGDQLKNFYGERVVSRMREIFNFIEFPGSDRRK